MAEFVTVATVDEIAPGDYIALSVDDEFILLFNIGGEFYAIADRCTHDDGPLEDGDLNGHAIHCPRHGAAFDVRTGDVLSMPATQPVETYPVRVVGDEVQIAIG
jgi:3-phenylpropionate/trans-cinnamate dioxygenase ferredoxin subunit